MTEPTPLQLVRAAPAISGCHCDRAREAYDARKKLGLPHPKVGMHGPTGEFLHRMPPGGWPLPPGIEHAHG